MSELQVGGLALVYGFKNDVEKNGLMVTLVEQPESAAYGIYSFEDWVPGDWVCEHPSLDGGIGMFMPRNLLPVKPEADPLDVTHKEELHA